MPHLRSAVCKLDCVDLVTREVYAEVGVSNIREEPQDRDAAD